MNFDEVNITETASGVVEFEFLCHDLLNHHKHHVNLSVDDYQHLPNNSTKNEDRISDSDECLYDLENLHAILVDYEDLAKNFDLIIRSSTKNSGMFLLLPEPTILSRWVELLMYSLQCYLTTSCW